MKNLYCPNCGGANAYDFQRPNFCLSCGNRFSWSSKIPLPPRQEKQKPQIDDEDEDEDEEEIDNTPRQSFSNLQPFKFELDIPENTPYTIKSISQIKEPMIDLDAPTRKLTKKQMKENLVKLQKRVRSRDSIDIK
jgi:hypothetical protein